MILTGGLLKVWTLTTADMKGRYRNTFAGFFWVMFNPLIMFSVHSLVFKYILRIQVERYFVFLLAGLLPWIFMSNTISQTSNTFLSFRDVLLSFQIHPLSLLLAKLLDNFINFIIPFFLLFIFVAINEEISYQGLWYLPLNLALLLGMTIGLNVLASTLQVFFRDVQYVVQFGFSVLYFMTPIFYPEEMVPDKFHSIIDWNPFYAVIKPFQKSLWRFDQQALNDSLVHAVIYTAVVGLISHLVWKRKRNDLYHFI